MAQHPCPIPPDQIYTPEGPRRGRGAVSPLRRAIEKLEVGDWFLFPIGMVSDSTSRSQAHRYGLEAGGYRISTTKVEQDGRKWLRVERLPLPPRTRPYPIA